MKHEHGRSPKWRSLLHGGLFLLGTLLVVRLLMSSITLFGGDDVWSIGARPALAGSLKSGAYYHAETPTPIVPSGGAHDEEMHGGHGGNDTGHTDDNAPSATPTNADSHGDHDMSDMMDGHTDEMDDHSADMEAHGNEADDHRHSGAEGAANDQGDITGGHTDEKDDHEGTLDDHDGKADDHGDGAVDEHGQGGAETHSDSHGTEYEPPSHFTRGVVLGGFAGINGLVIVTAALLKKRMPKKSRSKLPGIATEQIGDGSQ